VASKFGDQRHIRLHTRKNDRVDAVHIAGDQLHHRIERGGLITAERSYLSHR